MRRKTFLCDGGDQVRALVENKNVTKGGRTGVANEIALACVNRATASVG